MKIRTKAEFFKLWEAGVLGNKLRTWRQWDDAVFEGDTRGMFGFREIGKAGGGKFEIVPYGQIQLTAIRWDAEHRKFIICEAAPDHRGLIQGEVCRLVGGYHGMLGFVRNGKRMRDSIRDGDLKVVSGAQVTDLLNRFMDPASRDDLDALLDLYPDATVEFTCYEIPVGCIPGRSTIFWEVRNY